MADLSRHDWYGRALSVNTGLRSGTVLQCLYRLESWGWLESRWEDRDVATRDGRPPRRFYRLAGVGQQEAGDKREQTAQLGNAVTPPPFTWLTRQAIASLHPETRAA